MTLSRHEQQVLEEIEQDLAASRSLRWRRSFGRAATQHPGLLAGLIGASGLALLAVGLATANGIGIVAALIGYALIVLAAWFALTAITRRRWFRSPRR